MAKGYIQNGASALEMTRQNTKYWDAEAEQWKAPREAYYYDGTKWEPFILAMPSPGTQLQGGSSGNVYHYERPWGESSTYYIDLVTLIREYGYSPEDVMNSGDVDGDGGKVRLNLWREYDYDTTRNIGFGVSLYVGGQHVAGAFGAIYAASAFSIDFEKTKISDGMYLRWTSATVHEEDVNTGWQFPMAGEYNLEFLGNKNPEEEGEDADESEE